MRFENRALVKVYVEQEDRDRLEERATEEGMLLGEWGRKVLMASLEGGKDVSKMEAEEAGKGVVEPVAVKPKKKEERSFTVDIDETVSRKMGHQVGCDCIHCERIRGMLSVGKK